MFLSNPIQNLKQLYEQWPLLFDVIVFQCIYVYNVFKQTRVSMKCLFPCFEIRTIVTSGVKIQENRVAFCMLQYI